MGLFSLRARQLQLMPGMWEEGQEVEQCGCWAMLPPPAGGSASGHAPLVLGAGAQLPSSPGVSQAACRGVCVVCVHVDSSKARRDGAAVPTGNSQCLRVHRACSPASPPGSRGD